VQQKSLNLQERYIVLNNSVVSTYQVQETSTEYVLVPQKQIIIIDKDSTVIFNNKFDAMYNMFLDRITSGKSKLKNYKGSKLFNQYLERLQKENPELLFS